MKSINGIIKKIGLTNILIVLMQLTMYPYLLYYFLGLPEDNIMSVAYFVIIAILCKFKSNKKGNVPHAIMMMMFVQSFIWLFYCLLHNDTAYLVRIFYIILAFLMLLLLSKDNSIVKFSKVYSYTIAIQGVMGVVAFVLIFINVLKPIISIPFNDYGGYLEFYGLTCSKVHLDNFIRVNGFFDEPGAFAFWGMFALLFNKLMFDNKKLEIIIMVSLLFTFSAAYFVLLPIYFFVFYLNKLKSMLIILLLLAPLFYFAANSLSDNAAFIRYTTERFEGGSIESTRYDQAELSKKYFISSPIFGVGAHNLEDRFGPESSDNPYEILAKDGIVGLIITYLPLLYMLLKYGKRKEVLGTVLILSLDYGQRPFHINEMHFFMLYLLCTLIILKYEKSYGYVHTNNIGPVIA